ncbi:MAG: outer membrane protein [Bacteroidia bacterium]|jgi:outer membrane protein
MVTLILVTTMANTKSYAQKWAYVDSEYILSQLPDYKSAQKQIDELAAKWQKEIEGMRRNLDSMYKEFNAEEVLLNNDQKKQREAQIVAKEREIAKVQQEKFGYEGLLFKKREELIKPIQDRVFDAIQKVAKREALDFILDKSGDLVMLYSNARFDKSGEVLAELGITSLDERKNANPDNLPGQD